MIDKQTIVLKPVAMTGETMDSAGTIGFDQPTGSR